MGFLEQVPRLSKCECTDPHCLGYFVDNVEVRQGRFKKEDALLILHRKNLAVALKLFIGYMRTKGLDGEDRVIYQDLIKLQGEIRT